MSSKEWIHERFASLLGFSEDTSVEFILMIGKYLRNINHWSYYYIAQKAKSIDEISNALTDFGFPASNESHAFASNLFEKYSSFYESSKVRNKIINIYSYVLESESGKYET